MTRHRLVWDVATSSYITRYTPVFRKPPADLEPSVFEDLVREHTPRICAATTKGEVERSLRYFGVAISKAVHGGRASW